MKKKRHSQFIRRQHMLHPVYEIYYYSDLNLPPVAPHTHDFYELYFFLEGDVELTIGTKKHRIQPGEFYFVPPGITHFPAMIAPDKPYRRFVLWLNKEYYEALVQETPDYAYIQTSLVQSESYVFSCDPIIFNAIQAMIFQLIDEEQNERFGKTTQLQLLLSTLLLYLNRTVYEHDAIAKVQQEESIYQKVSHYIDDHLALDLSLDSIASGLYLSKFYLSHAFKDETGLSLHQYIIKRRLQACKNAILNEDASCEVCYDYGFRDYSSFYRAFKKEYGTSPKAYRKQMLSVTTPPIR